MRWFIDHYVPDRARRFEPEASPLLYDDVSDQPPAHVVIAGFDPLRDEGLAYAAKLTEAGVAVTVDREKVAALTVLQSIASLNTACTVVLVETPVAFAAGIRVPTLGGVLSRVTLTVSPVSGAPAGSTGSTRKLLAPSLSARSRLQVWAASAGTCVTLSTCTA